MQKQSAVVGIDERQPHEGVEGAAQSVSREVRRQNLEHFEFEVMWDGAASHQIGQIGRKVVEDTPRLLGVAEALQEAFNSAVSQGPSPAEMRPVGAHRLQLPAYYLGWRRRWPGRRLRQHPSRCRRILDTRARSPSRRAAAG